MAGNLETLKPEVGEFTQIQERAEEFPEAIQQIQGAKVVQKIFKAQVNDDKGQPLIQTPPTQVVTVQPPSDTTTLTKQAKGSVSLAATWLAAFWLRIIKKALLFGWHILETNKDVS